MNPKELAQPLVDSLTGSGTLPVMCAVLSIKGSEPRDLQAGLIRFHNESRMSSAALTNDLVATVEFRQPGLKMVLALGREDLLRAIDNAAEEVSVDEVQS